MGKTVKKETIKATKKTAAKPKKNTNKIAKIAPVAKETKAKVVPKKAPVKPAKTAVPTTKESKPVVKKAITKKVMAKEIAKKPENKPAAKKIAKIMDAVSMLVGIAVKAMQEKKGKDIVTLDLRRIKNSITDFFVVCHGESNTQVNALARSVEDEIYKALGEDPFHKEGFENSEWILLDYFNMVVHVFNKEKRDFFGIERLWADAIIEEIK